jgi:four helix bundle protein
MKGKISRFEDFVAWQKARQLAQSIYRVTRQEAFSKDWSLRDQIRRATVSIVSNIAEGFERGNRAEFHQIPRHCKSFMRRGTSQLYVALDVGYIIAAHSPLFIAR